VTGQISYTPAQLAMLLGLPEPTGEQAAVIAAPLAPLAVIAGAGSGKSETMAARLVWLVANGLVTPERALGLTFTRKAAAELGQRVRARLAGLRRAGLAMGRTEPAAPGRQDGQATALASQDGRAGAPGDGRPRDGRPRGETAAAEETLGGEPVVSTYHAYAARLVADHALREALEPSLRLITPAVAWQIAARVVATYSGPMDAVDKSPQWVTAAVLDLAAELSEHLRTPGDVQQVGRWLDTAWRTLPGKVPALVRKITDCQRTREQLLPMVAAYTQAKAAREVIDYGDQVALAARIASRHPQVGAIERARYQVVLLDEYQDTSHAQLVLLQALFGGGHPVTAVGDPCQSIYGWRGASAGNLRRFAADFPVAGQHGAGQHGAGSRLRGLGYGVAAGAGFGLFFLFLKNAGQSGVLWPVAVSRTAGTLVAFGIALATRTRPWRGVSARTGVIALVSGAVDAAANVCYVLATRAGLFGLAVVITSLYPGMTVLLARWVLGERMRWLQRAGLLLAAAGVVLLTT